MIKKYSQSVLIMVFYHFNAIQASPQTITVPAEFHALNEPIISVLNIPPTASASRPVPACLIFHGSGGLFSEGDVGENCDTSVNNITHHYNELIDLFNSIGVASLAPSSFVSRDSRFCEDNNENYFQFVAPPFHNPGDGIPVRNKYYKMRRVVIRTLDVLAAYKYLCSLDKIDCNNTCMTGTSNGATTIMSYIANDIGHHLKEYTDIKVKREHESNSDFDDRILAFENFPNVPNNINKELNSIQKPLFANAISPGCSLRKIVPTITADENDFDPVAHLLDLYYPAGETQLHLEIGTADDVPDACYNGGVREVQAFDYETIQNIDINDSQYLISTYENAPHDLLGEETEGEQIRQKIKQLAIKHFFLIYKNSFE